MRTRNHFWEFSLAKMSSYNLCLAQCFQNCHGFFKVQVSLPGCSSVVVILHCMNMRCAVLHCWKYDAFLDYHYYCDYYCCGCPVILVTYGERLSKMRKETIPSTQLLVLAKIERVPLKSFVRQTKSSHKKYSIFKDMSILPSFSALQK